MKKLRCLLLLSCLGLVACQSLLNPKPSSTNVARTIHEQPDGSTVTTEVPIVDTQKQAHAEATKSLFSE